MKANQNLHIEIPGESPDSTPITGPPLDLLSQALREFESDCITRLDTLEDQVNNLMEQYSEIPSERLSQHSSSSSLDKTLINNALQEMSSENLTHDTFNFNDSMAGIISDARETLFSKATTKKLIEKANLKYVDSSFQRFSTEITAQMTQKAIQKHQSIEETIDQIDKELTDLKERATKEFAELRAAIKEIKEVKQLQIEEELARNARFNLRRKYAAKSPNVIRKRDNIRLLRPKTNANKDSVSDLVLLPHKG